LNALNRWNFGLGYGVLNSEQDRSDRAARAAGNLIVENWIVKLSDSQAAVCVALMVLSGFQPGVAQQAQQAPAPAQAQSTQASPTTPALQQPIDNNTKWNSGLPQAPEPTLTQPLYLRPTDRDFTDAHRFLPNPLEEFKPTPYPAPRLSNTPRLVDLLSGGKIYLSLTDAVTLALENNFDIEIARINLDIADTDILRAKAGSSLRGVSTGLVTNTLGGTTSTITGGGGPGGTTSGTGGSGAGASGLVLSTSGGGPTPETMEPVLSGTLQLEKVTTQSSSVIAPSATTNTLTGNFQYNEGFSIGSQFNVTFNNTRTSTNSSFSTYSPGITTTITGTYTQHLLQGCCRWVNTRFIIQAKNDRRITDSAFRQQLLYTVGQVESIYWALVSAYEDEQAKERALLQSTQLSSDNRKQLQIGTLAPLDVVNSDSAVATDQQALIASKSNLEYQQLLMVQAIARNLDDPQLATAPVVPTDRVGLDRLPEEDQTVEALVKEAYVNNPQVEQAVLTMQNNLLTIRAEKNGLLPTLDAYGFVGSQAIAGTPNPNAANLGTGTTVSPSVPGGYGGALQNLFSGDYPNYGAGLNLSINLRNRTAQADQVRSQMEYRQSQIRLQQLYTQLRIQVTNAQFALTNDRAAVNAAQSARDYAAQALDAEQKKYRLGASTTANVLQMERNLATAEDNLISATAAYARDRVSLEQILAITLDRYGINIEDAAKDRVQTPPHIPGLTAPKAPEAPKPLTATP
jgi:outer membrane protein TolC